MQAWKGYNFAKMKKAKRPLTALAAISAAAFFGILAGCETESADKAEISLSPSAATLRASNPSVSLTASGGWNYNWSLSDTGIGSLSRHTGSSVVYTAKTFGSKTVQTVTVTVGGVTNSTGLLKATATITQAD